MNPTVPPASGSRSLHSVLVTAILVVLLIAAVVFGFWAYSGRQDYKNNTNQKIAAAVAASDKQLTTQLQAQFAQQAKSPYKVFQGSPTYGGITFDYPKTWSAYVDTTQQNEPINAYFFPNEIPGVQSGTAFALRLELVSNSYSQVLQQYSGQIQQGVVTAQAYLPPKLKGVANVQTGTLLKGQVNLGDNTQNGTMLIISVRDKTLELSTQSKDFSDDFNNIILPSLSFAP